MSFYATLAERKMRIMWPWNWRKRRAERKARERRLNAMIAMARDLNGGPVMHRHGQKSWCINPSCK